MNKVKQVVFGILSVVCIGLVLVGVYGVVTAENTKAESSAQLEKELKKNAELLKEQQESTQTTTNQAAEKSPTEPGTSTASSTTTGTTSAMPSSDKRVTAVGDSVLLGASPVVKKALPNSIIDAKESRQVWQAMDSLKSLNQKGQLADTVIIALGSNGTFKERSGQELIDYLGSGRKIYWVTTYGVQWQDAVNKEIRKLAKENKNIEIVDWAVKAKDHPNWFYNDGIHLNEDGKKVYAKLILESIT